MNREIRELNASFPRLCPFTGPLCSLDNNDAIRPRKGAARREVEFARRKGSTKSLESARTFSIIADTSQRTKWRGLPWPEIVLGKPHFRPRSSPTPPIYFQGEIRFLSLSLSPLLGRRRNTCVHLPSYLANFLFHPYFMANLINGCAVDDYCAGILLGTDPSTLSLVAQRERKEERWLFLCTI